jgi:hypothetical protein
VHYSRAQHRPQQPQHALVADAFLNRVHQRLERDRLGSRESVTAWMLIVGATVAALLARSAGYPWAARGFYCFLIGFSWAAAALYVQAGLGAVPEAWVLSTLTASLLWFAVDLRQGVHRAEPGRRSGLLWSPASTGSASFWPGLCWPS